MKSNHILTAILLAGTVALVATAQAQSVTGTPYLSNVSLTTLQTAPSALYGAWSTGAGISSTPTGLRVQSSGYGSLYYVLPGDQVQTMNASSTHAQFVFTVGGNAADYNWIGTPFRLNGDNAGSYLYGNLYSGSGNPGNPATVSWNGNTVTWTVPLAPAQLAAVQGGNEHIYSFNIELDPASLINGRTSYDITFNSLALTVVPEPTTFALLGVGALLMAFLRRS